jgi:putative FmdB family regulatory protein
VPTYSYACTACDHRFDAVQSFSDDSLTVCPECGGRLRKVFSAVGVVFKGGGFYRTDSRSGSSATVPAGKSESGSESSGSSTKPAEPAKATASAASSKSADGSAA